MGRIITCGFGSRDQNTKSPAPGQENIFFEGSTNTFVSVLGGVVHGLNPSLKCDTGTGTNTAKIQIRFSGRSPGTGVYARYYQRFDTLPSAINTVAIIGDDVGVSKHLVVCRLDNAGKLSMWVNDEATQVGSDSSFTVTPGDGKWYRIEIFCKLGAGATDQGEVRVAVDDGTPETLGTTSGQNWSDGNIDRVGMGWDLNTGPAFCVSYIADVAVNDDSGSDQNSWPGEGRTATLFPVSDNSIGSWTGGVGGTTNLYLAVTNAPPIGTSAETDLTQIESAANSASDNCDFNCQSYDDVGIPSNATITVMQGLICHGEDTATGPFDGAMLIVSNPAQSPEDTFVYGNNVGALGNWPGNWGFTWGTPQYNPTVTRATKPVLRVGKRTATTNVVSCCYLAINVEYVPGPTLEPTATGFLLKG